MMVVSRTRLLLQKFVHFVKWIFLNLFYIAYLITGLCRMISMLVWERFGGCLFAYKDCPEKRTSPINPGPKGCNDTSKKTMVWQGESHGRSWASSTQNTAAECITTETVDIFQSLVTTLSKGELTASRHKLCTPDGWVIYVHRLALSSPSSSISSVISMENLPPTDVGDSSSTQAMDPLLSQETLPDIDIALEEEYTQREKPTASMKSEDNHGNLWEYRVENERSGAATFFSSSIIASPGIPESPQSVFLQHGLFESSLNWIATGECSLAFMLARQGWDVWLGNSRGNNFTTYSPLTKSAARPFSKTTPNSHKVDISCASVITFLSRPWWEIFSSITLLSWPSSSIYFARTLFRDFFTSFHSLQSPRFSWIRISVALLASICSAFFYSLAMIFMALFFVPVAYLSHFYFGIKQTATVRGFSEASTTEPETPASAISPPILASPWHSAHSTTTHSPAIAVAPSLSFLSWQQQWFSSHLSFWVCFIISTLTRWLYLAATRLSCFWRRELFSRATATHPSMVTENSEAYSFHDMGTIDIPLILSHIASVRQRKSGGCVISSSSPVPIVCVGQSQGAAQLLIAACTLSSDAEKSSISEDQRATPASLKEGVLSHRSVATEEKREPTTLECSYKKYDLPYLPSTLSGETLYASSLCVRTPLYRPYCLRSLHLFSPPIVLKSYAQLPWILRKLVLYGLLYPKYAIGCFQKVEGLLPGDFLAFCANWIASTLCGFSCSSMRTEDCLRIFKNTPNGTTSVKNCRHWRHIIETGGIIKRFEGSEDESSFSSPFYPLSSITCPITVYFGEKDNLVHVEKSISYLQEEMRNNLSCKIVTSKDWSHVDFGWGSYRFWDFYPHFISTLV
ncbi:triacylglycerol lipase [Cardiosporidium cionae]|uniref:Triacylglycerol lipase n=1 Tax=Cardiosporidium cionae TaxID=476202 RepID=A0ABQ7J735_9APIC|nr:triacylglycerol lipase [Cardiosporidium cionae]|eukprot:KAF8819800.1 triacylglycerol lipase [Cardiosporidium cionae]